MNDYPQVYNAETLARALWGKSHYCDPNNRRYHDARWIIEPYQLSRNPDLGQRPNWVEHDRFAYFVESVRAGMMPRSGRHYRAVRIDLSNGRVDVLDADGKAPADPIFFDDERNAKSSKDACERFNKALALRRKALARKGSRQ